MGVIVLLLLLLVDLSCGTQAAATISMGNPHQVGPASESWTATCIASDLPSSQSSSGYSVIGGYLSVDADTAHFKVIKRNVDDGRILWIQTIEAAPGRKNLVLSCTIDSAGDVYVATASNDPMYGGVGTIGTGRYGLFLSKLSGCDGSNVWKQALNRTSNGAGDSLDIAWNPIKNEVVLFGQVHRFDIIVPALNRYNATSGILLDDMSHLFEPDGVTITIASRVVVDLSGTIFVALRIPNLNYIERSCPAADCSICLIEKIGSWRVQTSSNYNCSSVTLAVDRFSNNLVVYMDGIDSNMQQVSLIAKVRNVNYPEKPVPELNEIVPATTQIGAVFAYNGIVLVSGVTTRDLNPGQESLDGNGECFKEPRSSFIAMLNQTGGISEARYLARIDGESIPLEMRSSGMAWSTHASKLLVLTREYDDDKNIETAVWAPIEGRITRQN